jgi:phenylpropionate dioxygenase-like ring-hydroxylating dioxygenase large terminal subunit
MIKDAALAMEWLPVCLSSEVTDKPLQIKAVGEPVVIFRTQQGVHALKDVCVHRGAPLSLGRVRDDCLVCPYHGWTYKETGECVKIPQLSDGQVIPPKAHTQSFACMERLGLVWINLMSSDRSEPYFAESDDILFEVMSIGPYPVQASAPRLIENFLDVGHLAFLHEGYLGDPQYPFISDYQVHWHEQSNIWVSDEIVVIQPNGDGRGKTISNTYIYEIVSPVCVRFRKTDKDTGDTVSIMLAVLPGEEFKSSAFFIMGNNFQAEREAFIAFQELIFHQDIEVLENQKPEELPLDFQAELHLKADRMSLAYRKHLINLGISWGTSGAI